MQSGLVGEALEIYDPQNLNLVNWTSNLPAANTPITWYAAVSTHIAAPYTIGISLTM